ncbi:BBE domain-containing protein [Nocardia stercoris]|uniref:BBE domain-containing protein n=1 Tax=Nocardia stercoris TaxID=2483361 RepID=UPI00131A1E99|nr:BBE domain-containing protein [Nocardia stercoris]
MDLGTLGPPSRPGQHETVVGHRAVAYVARAITAPSADEWSRRELLGKTLAPRTLGHHLNFVYGGAEHASPAQTRAGYDAGTYDRLVALKSELDPASLFRFNRTIR